MGCAMTRKQPRQKRVNDIIEAAVEELLEKGYEGASMESIAARAGLTKGGLYHHFGGKNEILLAANARFSEPIVELLAAACEAADPREGLRGYIRGYLRHWARNKRQIQFTFLSFSKVLADESQWAAYAQWGERVVAGLESLFERGVEGGLMREHDCRARALSLMSALDGVTAYLVLGDYLDPAEVAVRMERTFIEEIEK